MSYAEFLSRKLSSSPPTGLATVPHLSPRLFPFQRDLVTWALKRGRAALFADTGLGKTRMQLEWAHRVCEHTGGRVLVLAPLSVAKQTDAEGVSCGVHVRRAYDGITVSDGGVYVTNYDRLHLFDVDKFAGVVLDESSIIKHHNAKTLTVLLERFKDHQWKLCCSATPSPNDYTELGTHAEFLGICSRAEMLAEFFCHDGGDTSLWRLKGHARVAFWRWVASWAAMLRRPSDLGYQDDGYVLPALHVHEHVIAADPLATREAGLLFPEPAKTLMDRRKARRNSLGARVDECVGLVQSDDECRVIWCELNDEQDSLKRALGDAAVSITGAMVSLEKELGHEKWLRGEVRILITKPSIFGWGLNWQHCARMTFVGVSDSWERYYQAVRRIYRFGQKRECVVDLIYSENEGSVLANLKRKEEDAKAMAEQLVEETRETVRAEVRGSSRQSNAYEPSAIAMPDWLVRRPA